MSQTPLSIFDQLQYLQPGTGAQQHSTLDFTAYSTWQYNGDPSGEVVHALIAATGRRFFNLSPVSLGCSC